MRRLTIVAAALTATLLSACADRAHKPVPEEEFGSSVRHMIRAQTFNPLAGQTAGDAPSGMDGSRAANVLKTYRSAKPTAIEAPTVSVD